MLTTKILKSSKICLWIKQEKEVAEFLSDAMWDLVPETWIKSIDTGFFAICPGLKSNAIKKNLAKQIETLQGHMCADCKKKSIYQT